MSLQITGGGIARNTPLQAKTAPCASYAARMPSTAADLHLSDALARAEPDAEDGGGG